MKLFAVLLLMAGLLTPAQFEHRTEWRTNQAREVNDADRLPHGRCVARFASAWAEYLAATGQFYHQELGGPGKRCSGRAVGEVLVGGALTPKIAVASWLASNPHRHVLLGTRYDHMGAGSARTSDGAWIVSLLFIEH